MDSLLERCLSVLTDCGWKSVVVLGVAWAVARACKGASAATRHLIWRGAFVALLALPILSPVLSSWRLFSLPIQPARSQAHQITPAPSRSRADSSSDANRAHLDADSRRVVATVEEGPSAKPASEGLHGASVGLLLWFCGSGVLLARWAMDARALRRIHRGCRPLVPGSRCAVAESGARVCAERAGFRPPVRLSVVSGPTDGPRAPMTWGVIPPVVYLPADAEEWPSERIETAILHELAHVGRRDCLAQRIAQLASALYWFNPLSHIAARQMRAEGERACDDAVLRIGIPPTEYAEHLIAVARSLTAEHRTSAAAAMARSAQVENRLRAILEPSTNRTAPRRMAAVGGVAVGLTLLVGLGVLRFAARAESQQSAASTGNGWEANIMCDRNLKFVALAWGMYAQDNDDRMPPTKDMNHFRWVLKPYTKGLTGKNDDSVFSCPATGKAYEANSQVGGKPYYGLQRSTIVLRDSAAHSPLAGARGRDANGWWNGVMVDGRVDRLHQAGWTSQSTQGQIWQAETRQRRAERPSPRQLRILETIRDNIARKIAEVLRENHGKPPSNPNRVEHLSALVHQYEELQAHVKRAGGH